MQLTHTLLLFLIFSVLLFQSDKKLYILILVKIQIFLCHTYLATYKILNCVIFYQCLCQITNRVWFNTSVHKYISFVETSWESLSYIFYVYFILQIFMHVFSKLNVQKNSSFPCFELPFVTHIFFLLQSFVSILFL